VSTTQPENNDSCALPPEAQPFGCICNWQRQDYMDKLIEPELLRKAATVHGTGRVHSFWTQLAVPVGVARRGGHVVTTTRAQARRIARILGARTGFPKPRVIVSSLYSPAPPDFVYYEVEWGDPAPHPNADPNADNVERGIYYGYSDKAILNFIVPQRRYCRKRRALLELIRVTRPRRGVEPMPTADGGTTLDQPGRP
jgi:hypothetical protein